MLTKSVKDVLASLGPALSSTLAEKISADLDIPAVTARKRIERAKRRGEIQSLKDIRFRHNEQLLFLPEHAQQKRFAKKLLSLLSESNSSYRLPILGVMARGGAVPEFLFSTVSAFPMVSKRNTDKPTADSVLARLISSGLLEHDADLIRVHQDLVPQSVSHRRIRARCSAEQLVLAGLKDFFSLQGLTTAAKCKLRSSTDTPQFGFYAWDFVAPSFTQPLATDGMPGFIVADVVLGRSLTVNDTAFFTQKCSQIRAYSNGRPFIAMLISSWFEKDALMNGRQQGLVFTTPKNLFGNDFARLLDSLTQAFEMKSKFLVAKPDYLIESLDQVSRISHWHDAFLRTRHALFTVISAVALSRHLQATLEFAIAVDSSGADYDFAMRAGDGTSIFVICNDRPGSSFSENDVQEWIYKVRNIRKMFGNDLVAICTSAHRTVHMQNALTAIENSNVSFFDFEDMKAIINASQPSLTEKFAAMFHRERLPEPPADFLDYEDSF